MHDVGAVVDGFELTASGEWVRRSPTAGSPYALGDVVDGHLLDADLRWVPLRRSPVPPYVAGDVVDAHVLTPAGDWVPLASRVRQRAAASGRRADARPAGAAAPGAASTAAADAARAAAERAARERAEAERAAERRIEAERAARRRAEAERAAQERAADGIGSPGARASASSGGETSRAEADAAPARRTYRVGDVVNGHVLTPENRWVPVGDRPASAEGADPARRAGATPTRSSQGTGPFGRLVPLLVLGFFALQLLRACG